MPINKLALIRYKVIDKCLQNRRRKWTLDDLVTACSDALYEYEGIKKGVSKRTVQLDIQNMRSEKIGYMAPIVVTDKKYYSYEDKNYSIANIPLSGQDMDTLNEVVGVLKQFKGFSYFNELGSMINRLEDKIYRQQNKGRSFISFETNNLLKGLEHIDLLHKAIINETALEITYQSFKAKSENNIIFYPYLLKEYRNRWFLIGSSRYKNKLLVMNLALDRIVAIRELPGEPFVPNELIDINTYYDDVIGVTKLPHEKPLKIMMQVDSLNAPYIVTKPFHSSQKIISRDKDGMTFSIEVIWNLELEREILGFGESIRVLSPRHLVGKLAQRINKMYEQYSDKMKRPAT
ncbi:MAG: helix-turn-helix transcriptional regulator [Flavipsychrobacter sp.]